MKLLLASAALTAALFAGSFPSYAETTLGSLTCRSEGAVGYIVGSSENVVCEFKPANSAQPVEVYAGTLKNVGLDVGITGETIMEWTVLAATDAYAPSSLAGTYVGASADASVVAGGGVKVLTGGPDGGFSLQPLSVQAQAGINAAIGVTEFTLVAVKPATIEVVPVDVVPVIPAK